MPGKVGFIGLGAMGGPMARNLAKHGFALVVHDIDRAKAEALRGVEIADSPRAVAADQAKVICFLASSDADFVTGVTIDVTGGL